MWAYLLIYFLSKGVSDSVCLFSRIWLLSLNQFIMYRVYTCKISSYVTMWMHETYVNFPFYNHNCLYTHVYMKKYKTLLLKTWFSNCFYIYHGNGDRFVYVWGYLLFIRVMCGQILPAFTGFMSEPWFIWGGHTRPFLEWALGAAGALALRVLTLGIGRSWGSDLKTQSNT